MNRLPLKVYGLAIATVISGALAGCSGENNSDNFWDDVDLVPVKLSKDGKWSMINDKGEVIYEDEFKNRPSLCYNGIFKVEEGEGITLYKPGDKGPVAIDGCENLKSAGFMEEGLIPVTKPKQRITLLDNSGKKKFELGPVKNNEVTGCQPSFSEGLLAFMLEDNTMGYFNTSGKVAIPAEYCEANPFADGLAVVAKEVEDSTGTSKEYMVIDTKGKTVFKIKDDYDLRRKTYSQGYLYVKQEDKCILLDKKGEATRLPSKIKRIIDFNDKYIIFANDDYECGVADIQGEVLIRPKYRGIIFDGHDTFLALKDKGEEVLRLDKDGKELASFDYQDIISAGKFGYFAKDGKTYTQIDKDGKPIGNDDYYDVLLTPEYNGITTDYFNIEGVAGTLSALIGDDSACGLKIGGTPGQVLKGMEPDNYAYTTFIDLKNLAKSGFRYEYEVSAIFTDRISEYTYDSGTNTGTYKWNPASKLETVQILLTCQTEWDKEGYDAIMKNLKSKGFKLIKEGTGSNSSYVGILKKGNLYVMIGANKDGKRGTIHVVDSRIPDRLSVLTNFITETTFESPELKKAQTDTK